MSLASKLQGLRSSGSLSRPRRTACYAVARQQPDEACSRRQLAQGAVTIATAFALGAAPSKAAGFKKELKKAKLTEDQYTESPDVYGLKVYELEEGRGSGPGVKEGDRVLVHWDVMFRGIDVASSRYARLLGGNRTIAEPFEFVAGQPVSGAGVRKINDGANGLFTGTGGPKPPVALSRAVLGMKKGGKRSVLVSVPQYGYGEKERVGEMPPGSPFELRVEILETF